MSRFESLSPQFYKSVRKKLLKKLPVDSLLMVQSNTSFVANADAHYPFRQNSDFYYLTGIQVPEVTILLYKSPSGESQEILFIPEIPEWRKVWDGEAIDIKSAVAFSGVKKVKYNHELKIIANDLIAKRTTIYHIWKSKPIDRLESEKRTKQWIQRHFPKNKRESCHQYIWDLRIIKTEEEIEAIEKALAITAEGLNETLSLIKKSQVEYVLEARLLEVFLRSKSRGFAFEPIIASGKNSCTLHYINNASTMALGQVLLMDIGAEFAGYNADITRVYPVTKFSKASEKVYEAVKDVLLQSISFYRPNTSIQQINIEVAKLVEAKLLALGLISESEIINQPTKKPAYRKYFMHSAAHFLGLDVHDVGDRTAQLKPGMVLTLEPGIYVPEWDTGVRLEEDILITKEGCRVLSKQIPLY